MSNFRIALLSTAAIVAAVAVSPASAGEVEKSLSVGGHVNRAVVVSDDGQNTTFGSIDNNSTGESRFRLKGSAKSESLTFGTLIELGARVNGNTGTHSNSDNPNIRIRHSVVSVGNNMGTLYLGQTWNADWLSTSNSLHGTGTAGFYDGHTVSGEVFNITGTANATSNGPSIGSVMDNYTHYRNNGVKYVSPNMSGFKVEIGHTDVNKGAASIRYSGDFDGTKVIGTIAIGSEGADTAEKSYGGSAAVKLAGGISGSLAYSKKEIKTVGRNDSVMWGAGLGYTMGANGITAWYQNVDDGESNGSDATAYALTVEHKMADYGASVYGGIQNSQYDTIATKYDDITSGWVGVKVTF